MIYQLSTDDFSDVDMHGEGFATSLTKKEMQSRSPLNSVHFEVQYWYGHKALDQSLGVDRRHISHCGETNTKLVYFNRT
jgi:hypothetical protein